MVRTWALELKRAGITANAVIPVAATAMTATVPYFAAAVEAEADGEPMPAFFRHDLGFGTADDVAGLIAYPRLRRRGRRHRAGASASAATACSCGRTRRPVVTAYRDGGWTLRRARGGRSAARSSGPSCRPSARLPPLPDDLQRPTARRAGRPASMTRYEPAIDLDAITAIDMHVHIEVDDHGHSSLPATAGGGRRRSTSRPTGRVPTLDAIAAYYRERRMAAVVFTVDAGTAARAPSRSPAPRSRTARPRNTDVLIPFGSVDPRTGAAAVDWSARLVETRGARLQVPPDRAGLRPQRRAYYPLLRGDPRSRASRRSFHTGQTGIGAGLPGGCGLRLGLSNPMLLDAVAADFPDLQIIMAHPSVPWQDEALSVATHKHNTWIDLSGWSPKYFPGRARARTRNSMLKDRVLFGSDFPLLTPDRWLRDVGEHGRSSPTCCPGILKDNAVAAARPA